MPSPQTTVDAWNTRVPVGTPVRYWTGVRERFGDAPPDEGKISRTSSEAWLIGGHTPVVRVYGESSCIALTHVQPPADGEQPPTPATEETAVHDDEGDTPSTTRRPTVASKVTQGHASPHCACGVNDAGDSYTDPICASKAGRGDYLVAWPATEEQTGGGRD